MLQCPHCCYRDCMPLTRAFATSPPPTLAFPTRSAVSCLDLAVLASTMTDLILPALTPSPFSSLGTQCPSLATIKVHVLLPWLVTSMHLFPSQGIRCPYTQISPPLDPASL